MTLIFTAARKKASRPMAFNPTVNDKENGIPSCLNAQEDKTIINHANRVMIKSCLAVWMLKSEQASAVHYPNLN